jgi:steroid delta-isomerase-like uncharacterized protein
MQSPDEQEVRPMKTPLEVVQAWVAAYNQRDAHAAAELYNEDATNFQVALGDPTVGRQAKLEDLLSFFHAFPDNFTRPENLFKDGEWAMLEWFGGGTWRGEFAGMAPNGRSFTLRGCGFFHITGGKIRSQRGYFDKATWFGQLGIPLAEV